MRRVPARILGTGSALPPRIVTTHELAANHDLGMTGEEAVRRTGIYARRWSAPGARSADLGAEALRLALVDAGLKLGDLERVIFVSSTGGDQLIPSTASHCAAAIDPDFRGGCVDFNNACTGFLSAFDLAARVVATGSGPIGIVAAEILSRYVRPEHRRSFLVMGDAAGAAIVGASESGGVLAHHFGTDLSLRDAIRLEHPSVSGEPSLLRFISSNREIGAAATAAICRSARHVLETSKLSPCEPRFVVPHQPNGRLHEHILATLEIPASRVLSTVDQIGSVGAASLPYTLDQVRRTGQVSSGDQMLLMAVGAGASHGAMVFEVAA